MKTHHYILTIVVILSACTFEKETKNSAAEIPDIILDTLNVTKYFGDCQNDTSVRCTKVIFNIPHLGGKDTTVSEAVNNTLKTYILSSFLADSANNSFEGYTDQFITDYKMVKDKFGEAFGWYTLVDGRTIRHDSSLLVIETSVKMYTGGAHGSDALYYLNFDLSNGRILALKDVFQAGFEERLNALVYKAFQSKVDGDSLENYQFDNDRYYNENFGLLPKGIKFYYNAYEIAPYAIGTTEIVIPYEKIKAILKITL